MFSVRRHVVPKFSRVQRLLVHRSLAKVELRWGSRWIMTFPIRGMSDSRGANATTSDVCRCTDRYRARVCGVRAGLSAGASASLPERIMEALSAPPDDHGAWPASQQGVSSPNLQLTLHGILRERDSAGGPFAGRPISIPSIWTGTTTSPSAATLRDRNFVDNSRSPRSDGWSGRRVFIRCDRS